MTAEREEKSAPRPLKKTHLAVFLVRMHLVGRRKFHVHAEPPPELAPAAEVEERPAVATEAEVKAKGLPGNEDAFLRLKQMGFSDARLATLTGLSEDEVAEILEKRRP